MSVVKRMTDDWSELFFVDLHGVPMVVQVDEDPENYFCAYWIAHPRPPHIADDLRFTRAPTRKDAIARGFDEAKRIALSLANTGRYAARTER
jgi:hypothetical protein